MFFNRMRGFTLLELMITLVIASILIAMAVPSFTDLIRNNRMSSDFNMTLADLAYARSEAVTRNTSISLCPTTNQTSCNGTSWNGGWLIFVDDGAGTPANAKNRDVDSGELILRVRPSLVDTISVASIDFTDGGGIRFDSDGTMELGDVTLIGEMIFCNEIGVSEAKGVSFSAFGQARIMSDTDSDGVVDYTNDAGVQTSVTCP